MRESTQLAFEAYYAAADALLVEWSADPAFVANFGADAAIDLHDVGETGPTLVCGIPGQALERSEGVMRHPRMAITAGGWAGDTAAPDGFMALLRQSRTAERMELVLHMREDAKVTLLSIDSPEMMTEQLQSVMASYLAAKPQAPEAGSSMRLG